MNMGDKSQFFLTWVTSPLRIGAPVASGRGLAGVIAQGVDPARPGVVVELGGGTGAITQALLRRGIPRGRLVVIERDQRFYELLLSRVPGVRIAHGDAMDLHQILADLGVDKVNTLVSGLPLLSMPPRAVKLILNQSFELIADGAVLLQFTYGLGSPVRVPFLQAYGAIGRSVATVWQNLPPARVWRYTKRVSTATPAWSRTVEMRTGRQEEKDHRRVRPGNNPGLQIIDQDSKFGQPLLRTDGDERSENCRGPREERTGQAHAMASPSAVEARGISAGRGSGGQQEGRPPC